jgi:hypothetical protein
MKQWYEKLFYNYGEQYDKESFTQGTIVNDPFTSPDKILVHTAPTIFPSISATRHKSSGFPNLSM